MRVNQSCSYSVTFDIFDLMSHLVSLTLDLKWDMYSAHYKYDIWLSGMGHEHFWTSGTDQGEESKWVVFSSLKAGVFFRVSSDFDQLEMCDHSDYMYIQILSQYRVWPRKGGQLSCAVIIKQNCVFFCVSSDFNQLKILITLVTK